LAADRPAVSRSVLVIEDEVLVGLFLADELSRAGFTVLGPCGTCADALKVLRTFNPDLAILDIGLKDGTCHPIARELKQRHVPFLVFSGFCRGRTSAIEFRPTIWIAKPAPISHVVRALHQLEQLVACEHTPALLN